ncbi:hypothetical protein KSZ26_06590 [Alistipes onderdonkii]|jgi:hypothetical protein|uniref:Uncharacterized protein n=1 Tax=Alistipes onderdonkii TaxID=328813 RepID=A0A5B3JEP3_9BACT|nr:hypothetical protein [Alistipes onderdonkii]KAA2379935.1 hypothetical protein F2Y10_04130 [Alistipes onderdonkii]KAA2383783.1 hypothetical protein F2Y05_00375 [Alistipes onderdonkii]KAA2386443.1 hypothetical protein F2Y11_04125 [Alistipes onderdonkii]KAA2390160.1 hypothetical protein F2Y03_04400 [Alistipes onderdonkii]KAA2394054.1 hypothetical protein F2X91_05430 [Alistipes onderdonkii]
MKSAIIVICFVFVNVRLSRARHAARRIAGTLQQAAPQPAGILPPRLLAALPTAVGRKQAAPGKYPARTPGVKAMQKYKKLSGLRNNFPPAVIIFTKRE